MADAVLSIYNSSKTQSRKVPQESRGGGFLCDGERLGASLRVRIIIPWNPVEFSEITMVHVLEGSHLFDLGDGCAGGIELVIAAVG